MLRDGRLQDGHRSIPAAKRIEPPGQVGTMHRRLYNRMHDQALHLLEEARAIAEETQLDTAEPGGKARDLGRQAEAMRLTALLADCLSWLLMQDADSRVGRSMKDPVVRLSKNPRLFESCGRPDPTLADLLRKAEGLHLRLQRLEHQTLTWRNGR